ncbi:FAD-binding oxidoreductase [Thermoleophilum album]|uniref:FAD/FMN-containing dehydrogenase n=1 Tax=Thermoleophilum album TaxID=29539 RepID=A0A1H6FIA3_THEAL|nr:FAD-binding oxidoreductase [Thermoleophilum album]SEH10567.1 FAD/FMN-containing dehydrogenase [Thermoleophilum album]
MSIISTPSTTAVKIVGPSDPDWDATRQVFNLAFDLRPAGIALPRNAAEVAVAIEYARERGLRVAPQATGHNAEAFGAALDDTMLVDVRRLQELAIDPGGQRVRTGAGVKWGRVTPVLSEHGLAVLHGSSPEVGVAGYSLGGGMGWLSRKYGLQASSVTAIEVVTADGALRRVDAADEPDLFWALRGGNGNYGVVTAIEFRAYPVEELYAGALFFPFERAEEVLRAWTELAPSAPEELMTWCSLFQFPDLPFVPEPVRGGSFAVVLGAYLGDEQDGRELLGAVRQLGPVIDTFALVPPAALGDLAMDPPMPLPLALTSALLNEVPIAELLAAVGPDSGSPLALVQLRQMGEAMARLAPHAGARATLPGNYCLLALGVPSDAESAATADRYLRAVDRAVARHVCGEYGNFVTRPADASAFFDPETWARLRMVKAAYDPGELFRGNHYIPPATVGEPV